MKNSKFRFFMDWGLTALAVIASCVLLCFALLKFSVIAAIIKKIITILMPIIYGGVLAYLMLPVYNRTEVCVRDLLSKVIKNDEGRTRIAKSIATLVSLAVLFAIVSGLVSMLIPQIYESIIGFQDSLTEYINNLTVWISKLLQDNEHLQESIMPYYNEAVMRFQNWIATDLVPNISLIFDRVSSGVISLVTVLKNLLIGLIVMVYFLNIKDTLCAQSKKMVYGFLNVRAANRLIGEVRFAHKIFGGFITGKLLDSLIIGIMCFFSLKFLKMPYVLLISVIVGVTNVIPFFGPFIGAVPSAFLILLVDPMKCLYFLIFILVLQQFDGNILGPKILGDSTGLPSFWVLFSILLFGGLFGFVGMIIAVPTFAVIYRTISLYINSALKKKNYSKNTPDYCRLHHIDPRSGDFIDMDQWPEAGNKGMNDLDMAAGEELEEKTENIEK